MNREFLNSIFFYIKRKEARDSMNVAQQIVKTLEARGVQYVFGLPGEENITLIQALNQSEKINFILVHDERAAGFMAGTIGWLSDQPGVVIATLGPGALNMTLSIADAQSHSFPLIAIAAQGDLQARIKETTQVMDLKNVFIPITKWSEDLVLAESTSELINKAYNMATTDRTGASFVTIPASLEQEEVSSNFPVAIQSDSRIGIPSKESLQEAVELIKHAKKPLILAGLGLSRNLTSQELQKFVEKHQLPVTTTFMAKGTISEASKLSLGVSGFFTTDYIDSYLEEVDLILAVGYDFAEFDPEQINPKGDKTIINLHHYAQETHLNFPVKVQLTGNLTKSLAELSLALGNYQAKPFENFVQAKLEEEFKAGNKDGESPLLPAQIVHATRKALPEEGIAIVDTGAVKMWMARLFPTYHINTLLINNALSSMSWAIPSTIAAKLLYPGKKILTVVGDGAFLMSDQEILTAKRYNIPLTILIWDDSGYGLIKWKMKMDLGEYAEVDFENPDFVKLAEAYGGKGHVAKSRDDLEDKLKEALDKNEGLTIIVAPVDYKANMDLTNRLEEKS